MAFEGKVILITGASSGIGAACAEYFAKEGALLALVGRNSSKFEKLLEKIKESGVETEPLVIYADVSIDAERIISETIEKYDHLDVLINNAGFSIKSSLENISLNDFDAMMATNVRGVLAVTKFAAPHLIETRGNIINNSSVCGMRSFPNLLGYCITKAALDQLTKCIAMELAGKGVRVNSINPGFIDTDFHNSGDMERGTDEYSSVLEFASSMHPIGRVGEAEDCVNAIAILAKDNSSFITGVLLPVDGGLSAKGPFT